MPGTIPSRPGQHGYGGPVRNIPLDEVDHVGRAVLPIGTDYPPGHLLDWHAHRRAQFLYGATGVMVVDTADGTWTVPPERAVLIPAATRHRVRMLGVSTRSLYVEPDAVPWWPAVCTVVDVSPLLRELLAVAVGFEAGLQPGGAGGRRRHPAPARDQRRVAAPLPPARPRLRRSRRALPRLPGGSRRRCHQRRLGGPGGHERTRLHQAVPGRDRGQPRPLARAGPPAGRRTAAARTVGHRGVGPRWLRLARRVHRGLHPELRHTAVPVRGARAPRLTRHVITVTRESRSGCRPNAPRRAYAP